MMTESLPAPKSPRRVVSSGVTELSVSPVSAGDMQALTKKIQGRGLTIMAVCRRAGVTTQHFYMARAGSRTASRWFIRRCELALASLVSGEGMPAEPSEVYLRGCYRAFWHELARELGLAEGEPFQRQPTGPATIARHGGWYLLSTELAVRPARIADLFGVTRAAVTQALQAIEDRREDPAFDAALERIGARIMGRT
jgi:hypothetical protein